MKTSTKYILVGGAALGAYLLWRQSQRPKLVTAAAVPWAGIGGAIGSFLGKLTAPIAGLLKPGVEAVPGKGGYTFSEARGVVLKTTTAPPWIKGQVSGWSCWTKDGKMIPVGDPRCSAQIEAFTVLEGFERRKRAALGSLGGGRHGSLTSTGLGSLGGK